MKIDTNDIEGCRLLAEVGEATRALHIFKNPIAAARPFSAWAAIPFGDRVGETLTRLEREPEEHDPELHALYLRTLELRHQRALAAWHKYTAAKEGRTHVRH